MKPLNVVLNFLDLKIDVITSFLINALYSVNFLTCCIFDLSRIIHILKLRLWLN